MPSAKQSELKQKTLLGFFNKTAPSTASSSNAMTSKLVGTNKDDIVKTPSSKAKSRIGDEEDAEDIQEVNHSSSVRSSVKSHGSHVSGQSMKDTPPTSDVIDIDMLSDLTDLDDVPVEKPVSPLVVLN